MFALFQVSFLLQTYEYYVIRSFVGTSKLSCLRSRCCGIVDPYILNGDLIDSYDPKDVTASTLFNPCVHCACVLVQKVGYSILTC